MTAPRYKKVALPGGKTVQISDGPEPWWTTDDAGGYINPHLIAPDPKQPREHMDAVELAELTRSVKERGVRESIVVTPLSFAPWAEVAPEHKALPFLAVSGHRRRVASHGAELLAVPIRIKIYETEADHLLDASILNKDRADLTPIEEGREILRLKSKGVTLEKISVAQGCSVTHIYNRVNLTQLHPAIQALLNPELPPKKRLALLVAGELGSMQAPSVEELEELQVIFKQDILSAREPGLVPREVIDDLGEDSLRFEFQKILLSAIRNRGLNAARSVELIHEYKLQLESAQKNRGKKSERFKPRKRKEIIENLTRDVTGSTIVDWTPEEFRRIFEGSSEAEVEDYRLRVFRAAGILSDIETLLRRVRDEKKEASSKVTELVRRPA